MIKHHKIENTYLNNGGLYWTIDNQQKITLKARNNGHLMIYDKTRTYSNKLNPDKLFRSLKTARDNGYLAITKNHLQK